LQYFLTVSASNMLPSLSSLLKRPKIESVMPKGSQLVWVNIAWMSAPLISQRVTYIGNPIYWEQLRNVLQFIFSHI